MKKSVSRFVLLVTVLLIASGCGGGSSGDDSIMDVIAYFIPITDAPGSGPSSTSISGEVTYNSKGMGGVVVTISEDILGGASFTTTTIHGWYHFNNQGLMQNLPDDYQFSGDYTVTATVGNQFIYPEEIKVTIIPDSALFGVDFHVPKSMKIIWFVDINSPTYVPDGLSWDTAFRHPQDSADMAETGDQVWVADGTYASMNTSDPTMPVLTMKDGVEFYGGFAGTEAFLSERDLSTHTTVLDGEDLLENVVVGASHALLDGFVITRGNAQYSGAGILNEDVIDLEVVNSIFTSNVATFDGAGMSNDLAEVVVDNCIFRNNSALRNGSGMDNNRSEVVVDNCIFRNNSALSKGGGIINTGLSSYLVVYDTVFDSNTAAEGGGGHFSNGRVYMYNCLLINNSASDYGGGIAYWNNQQSTIVNSTITGNSADVDGGGYVNVISDQASGKIANYQVIANSIIYGNTPNQLASYGTGNTIVSHSNVQGGYAGTNINADPLFMDVANGDYRLASNSPCIDAGNDASVPSDITTDLDGNNRFADGDGSGSAEVDMGAYEYFQQ